MALMEKMSLNQASGGPGNGYLGKRIKKKAKEIKRKVGNKLHNFAGDVKREIRSLKSNIASNREDRQERREDRRDMRQDRREARRDNRRADKYGYDGTIKGISGSENNSEQAESKAGKGQYYAKRQPGERRFGKYSNPLLYKAESAVRKVGDAINQAKLNVQQNKGRRRAMADASGPTSRNKDVMVCKEGQCQTR